MSPAGFISPMMAESVKELPASAEWSYEVKLDGFRCIAARGAERARLYSRRGNSLTSKFPTIAQCLRDRLAPNTTLDGEIVALDSRGLPSFNLLQNGGAGGELVYYLFDILVERGRSLMKLD